MKTRIWQLRCSVGYPETGAVCRIHGESFSLTIDIGHEFRNEEALFMELDRFCGRDRTPCGSIGQVVGLGRVELPTNGLGNRCSIHLSYRPCGLFYRNQQNVWNWAFSRAGRWIPLRRSGRRKTITSMWRTCVKAERTRLRFVSAILSQKPRDRAALIFKGALKSIVANASA